MSKPDRPDNIIAIDMDRERIREIVGISYDFVSEFLGTPLNRTREQIMETLESILSSNRVSTTFCLDFSNKRMDDLQLRVDPRRREVLGLTIRFPTKKNQLNSFLRNL